MLCGSSDALLRNTLLIVNEVHNELLAQVAERAQLLVIVNIVGEGLKVFCIPPQA